MVLPRHPALAVLVGQARALAVLQALTALTALTVLCEQVQQAVPIMVPTGVLH
jgi:hypothetical protein